MELNNESDKLPRGHAYVRMRNRGTTVHFEWPELDSPQADSMMQAVMGVLNQDPCEEVSE